MFTGIVASVGKVSSIIDKGYGREIVIEYNSDIHTFQEGDSIAVNGACQTVEHFDSTLFSIFSIPETLSCTNLGNLKILDKVNLEDPLTLQTKISGHIIQGHVEGMAVVKKIEFKGNNILDITLKCPQELFKFTLKKGSICLDGISLTIQECLEEYQFRVQIIPETLRVTNILEWKEEYRVNVEVDYLLKSLYLLQKQKSHIN